MEIFYLTTVLIFQIRSNHFVFIEAQVSNSIFENGFWVLFLLKCIKYKHILSNISRELHLMVPVSLPAKSLVYEAPFSCL